MLRLVILIPVALLLIACAGNEQQPDRPARTTVAPEHVGLIPTPVLDRSTMVSVPEYLQFLDDLNDAIQSGETRPLNNTERQRHQQLDRDLRRALASVDSVDQLTHNQRVDVFNMHEELQAVVVGHPENQVICTRRAATTASRVRRTTCMTVEEFQYQQRRTEDDLRRFARIPMEMPENN